MSEIPHKHSEAILIYFHPITQRKMTGDEDWGRLNQMILNYGWEPILPNVIWIESFTKAVKSSAIIMMKQFRL